MFTCGRESIPYHKVCDGTIDCRDASDERYDCSQTSITTLLKCTREGIHITRINVNDGVLECPDSLDDELGHMFNSLCFVDGPCWCQGFAVVCRNIFTLPPLGRWTRTLYITGREYTLSTDTSGGMSFFYLHGKYLLILQIVNTSTDFIPASQFQNMKNVIKLDLTNNYITTLSNSSFNGLNKVLEVNLLGNPLKNIGSYSMSSMVYIRSLNLHNLQIEQIASNAFLGLHRLEYLNLSHNKLQLFYSSIFKGLNNLSVLDVSKNPNNFWKFKDIYLFQHLHKLKHLYVVYPELCCLVQDINCTADQESVDIINSCQDILAYSGVRVWCWAVMFLITLTNILAFTWWHLQCKQSLSMFNILSCNLSVSDGIMAVYICMLVAADTNFSGNVGYVVLLWKNSALCKVSGMILITSVQASIVSTLLIAIDRYICIVLKPFQKFGLSMKATVSGICIGWCFSILPQLVTIFFVSNVTSSACILVGTSVPKYFSFLCYRNYVPSHCCWWPLIGYL
jgi:hypothetical protein